MDVDHNVGLSSNKTNPGLVIHRTTPHNSLFIGVVRAEIPGVDERCCLQRFRVSLYFVEIEIIAARKQIDLRRKEQVATGAVSESTQRGSAKSVAMQPNEQYIPATSFLLKSVVDATGVD